MKTIQSHNVVFLFPENVVSIGSAFYSIPLFARNDFFVTITHARGGVATIDFYAKVQNEDAPFYKVTLTVTADPITLNLRDVLAYKLAKTGDAYTNPILSMVRTQISFFAYDGGEVSLLSYDTIRGGVGAHPATIVHPQPLHSVTDVTNAIVPVPPPSVMYGSQITMDLEALKVIVPETLTILPVAFVPRNSDGVSSFVGRYLSYSISAGQVTSYMARTQPAIAGGNGVWYLFSEVLPSTGDFIGTKILPTDCYTSWVYVQWRNRYGAWAGCWWRLSTTNQDGASTTELVQIDAAQFRQYNNSKLSITIYLDNLNNYDLWWYSDLLLTDDVRVYNEDIASLRKTLGDVIVDSRYILDKAFSARVNGNAVSVEIDPINKNGKISVTLDYLYF